MRSSDEFYAGLYYALDLQDLVPARRRVVFDAVEGKVLWSNLDEREFEKMPAELVANPKGKERNEQLLWTYR